MGTPEGIGRCALSPRQLAALGRETTGMNDNCMDGTELAYSADPCPPNVTTCTQTVTFGVTAPLMTGQQYELRIIPAFAIPGDSFSGVVSFTAGATGGGGAEGMASG